MFLATYADLILVCQNNKMENDSNLSIWTGLFATIYGLFSLFHVTKVSTLDNVYKQSFLLSGKGKQIENLSCFIYKGRKFWG